MSKVHGLEDYVYDSKKHSSLGIEDIYVKAPGDEFIALSSCLDSATGRTVAELGLSIEDCLTLLKNGKLTDSASNVLDKNLDFCVFKKLSFESTKPNTPTKLRKVYADVTPVIGEVSTADGVIKIDIGNKSSYEYVKKSQIYRKNPDSTTSSLQSVMSYDAIDNWKDLSKLEKDTWYYKDVHGTEYEIKDIFFSQEYDHIATEKLNSSTLEIESVAEHDITLVKGGVSTSYHTGDVFKTGEEAKIDKYDVTITSGTKKESTARGEETVPTFEVSSYRLQASGDYIKVRKKGTIQPILVNKSKITSGTIAAGNVLVLEGGVDTEPLTDEEATLTYVENLAFQPAKEDKMTEDTYVRVADGRYFKESKYIEPISFRVAGTGDTVGAYAVNIGGKWKIVNDVSLIAGRATFAIEGVDFSASDIGIDKNVRPLARCKFDDPNVEFVQTATGKEANECKKIEAATKVKDLEEARNAFLSGYNDGKYELDGIYDETTNSVLKLEEGRHVLTNNVTIDDVTSTTDGFQTIKNKNLKFVYNQNTGEITLDGGPKASFGEMTKKGLIRTEISAIATAGVAVNVLGVISGPVGMVVAVAAAAVAVGALAVVPIVNAIRVAVRNNQKFPDLLDKQQDKSAKLLNERLKELYASLDDQINVTSDYSDDLILGRIERFIQDAHMLANATYDDSCKRNADGEVIITPQNASRVAELRKELKNTTKADFKDQLWPPRHWFKNRAQIIDSDIREEAKKIFKAHNKLVSASANKIQYSKKLTIKELQDLVATVHPSIDTTAFNDAINARDVLKAEADRIFAEYEYPSGRTANVNQDILLNKAENLKVYCLVKKVVATEAAFDYETGMVLVGNQKLVKVGTDFELQDLTEQERKSLKSAKDYYKTATQITDPAIIASVKTAALKASNDITKEEGSDERSITDEILDFDAIQTELNKAKAFVADIEYFATASSILTDAKFTGIVAKAISTNIIPAEINAIIAYLETQLTAYEKQKAYVARIGKDSLFEDPNGIKTVKTQIDAIKTTKLAPINQAYKVEFAASVDGSIRILEDYDAKLTAGTMSSAEAASILADYTNKVDVHINKTRDFISRYDKDFKTSGIAGIDTLRARADAVKGLTFKDRLEEVVAKDAVATEMVSVGTNVANINAHMAKLDNALAVTIAGGFSSLPAELQTEISSETLNSTTQAEINAIIAFINKFAGLSTADKKAYKEYKDAITEAVKASKLDFKKKLKEIRNAENATYFINVCKSDIEDVKKFYEQVDRVIAAVNAGLPVPADCANAETALKTNDLTASGVITTLTIDMPDHVSVLKAEPEKYKGYEHILTEMEALLGISFTDKVNAYATAQTHAAYRSSLDADRKRTEAFVKIEKIRVELEEKLEILKGLKSKELKGATLTEWTEAKDIASLKAKLTAVETDLAGIETKDTIDAVRECKNLIKSIEAVKNTYKAKTETKTEKGLKPTEEIARRTLKYYLEERDMAIYTDLIAYINRGLAGTYKDVTKAEIRDIIAAIGHGNPLTGKKKKIVDLGIQYVSEKELWLSEGVLVDLT